MLSSKKFVVAQKLVKSAYNDLEKRFKYYRLSLYTYSLASMAEIMLGENYGEEYISSIKDGICKMTENYRNLFEKASSHLEKLGNIAVEANILKGIGVAEKAVGKFIGNIPLLKDGTVDERLQDSGARLKSNAIDMKRTLVYQFASLSNPGTGVFISKMEDMIQIYNHTEQICFDNERLYLVG